MVGDHQPVERTAELRRLAAGGSHLLAAGEAIGVVKPEPRAEETGIDRQAGMQVRVAPKHLVRETALRVG
jgi:hypothetical protein